MVKGTPQTMWILDEAFVGLLGIENGTLLLKPPHSKANTSKDFSEV